MNAFARLALLAATLALPLSACSASPPAQAPPGAETVVLVHGLMRTSASMVLLRSRLEKAGFRVISFGYPSRSEPVDRLVERLAAEVEACCAGRPEKVHFVTHSMGGIVVWRYLASARPENTGRVVMLSPPARGSEVIDAFSALPLLRSFLGPAGSSLGTGGSHVPATLGGVDFELGIIAGDRSLNPLGSWIIPGADDGKVAVERARVQGAADFLVLPATHTFIMNRRDVAEETVRFLKEGRFAREAGSTPLPPAPSRGPPAAGS